MVELRIPSLLVREEFLHELLSRRLAYLKLFIIRLVRVLAPKGLNDVCC